MRHLGVRGLAVHCLSQKCKHEAVFSADDYPDDVAVASFQSSLTVNNYRLLHGEPLSFPAHHRERYLGGAGKRQRVRRGRGEIDDTAAHEWAAIIDAHGDRAAVALVAHRHHRTEG